MPGTLVQIEANDFDSAMDFLDRVFSEHRPHNLRGLLPATYQPTDEHMRCNYAAKRHGDIKAIVGVFPITQHVGDTVLRIAGIGGVAVDLSCRGEGLMRLLMDHAVNEIDRAGYDLSWLGRKRQRYRYWGHDVGGTSLRFAVDGRALKHDLQDAAPMTLHEVAEEHDPAMLVTRSLHEALPTHCDRQGSALLHHLRNQHRAAWSARNSSGEIVGYSSSDPNAATAGEPGENTVQDAPGVVRSITHHCGTRWACFHMPAIATPLVQALSA
jgi:GNAT superfamily N-acetyltransferase